MASSLVPPATMDFPCEEMKVLALWRELDAFATCLKQSKKWPRFTFYDGPPFATGLPHFGHILAGTIKDILPRWMHQHGYHVERRFGWDTHGLPVEYEIDKTLNIKGPEDVAKMGIDKYNAECRKIVMRYASEWEKTTERLGRWIDFKNDYKTLYPWFMESVWWVFKQLWEKGLIYKGFRVMPYSTGCCTPLANFEASQNYKDVVDPAVVVSFPLDDDKDVSLVAWTTTPWTLPSNMALCVNPESDYVKIKETSTGKVFVLMEARLPSLYKSEDNYEILDRFKGKSLEGKGYEPIFPYFEQYKKKGAFRVLCDKYVTEESGTGVVHQAPYFGEDDNRVCLAYGVITKEQEVICPLDEVGRFTQPVSDFVGQYVKDADKNIIKLLKERGRLVNASQIKHNYPFCWRSDTPLLYRAVPSWFMKVEQMQQKLLDRNKETYWVPDSIKEGRFANWLKDARDWNLSRNRYWGTPIPVWVSEDGEEFVCVGSIAELEKLCGQKVTDLHRETVDKLTIPSARPGKPPLRRTTEVFDCWFESGSMPYAQKHYPFENKNEFEDTFPADFIAEGTDQTRGWFYTLLVLSTALFDKPPFKNLIVNGLVLASDGQKMSKRKKNYPDPNELMSKYGADALRLFLINSPVVKAESLRFKEEGVRDILKDVFLPWYNAFRFLLQNVDAYQQREGVSFLWSETDSCGRSSNVMDKWIVSFTQSLLTFVKREMAHYRLYTVLPRLMKFIDNLTNWYVRTNRRRLKGESNSSADCLAALNSLFSVLFTMVRVFAPFTPFLTETMYQRLRSLAAGYDEKKYASVHFVMIPEPRKDLIDEDIERSVARMQAVVELGRVIRDRKTMPIKYPLPELVLIHKDQQCLDDVRSLQDYVLDELNVKKLTLSTDKQQYGVVLRAEPNHKILGARLMSAFKDVTKEIKELGDKKIEEFLRNGNLTLLGHELGPDDLRIMYSFAGGDDKALTEKYEAHSDNDVLVLLDCTPDQSMLDEGISREVINRIQKLRKKAKLVPTDAVTVYYSLGQKDDNLGRIINEFKEAIESTTKSPIRPLALKQGGTKIVEENFDVKGYKLGLLITEGFCSDFVPTFVPIAPTVQNEEAAKPSCKFVNVTFQDRVGTILLENPVGSNVLATVGELVKELEQMCGDKLEIFEDPSCSTALPPSTPTSSFHGKTLYAWKRGKTLPESSTASKSGPRCKFVNVRGPREATFLLENPAGCQVTDYFPDLTRIVLGLQEPTLYLDKDRKKKVDLAQLESYAGKTLFV